MVTNFGAEITKIEVPKIVDKGEGRYRQKDKYVAQYVAQYEPHEPHTFKVAHFEPQMGHRTFDILEDSSKPVKPV